MFGCACLKHKCPKIAKLREGSLKILNFIHKKEDNVFIPLVDRDALGDNPLFFVGDGLSGNLVGFKCGADIRGGAFGMAGLADDGQSGLIRKKGSQF